MPRPFGTPEEIPEGGGRVVNPWLRAADPKRMERYGGAEADYGQDIMQQRIGGQTSLARAQQQGQLHDARRQMAAAGGSPLQRQQAMWAGAGLGGQVIGQNAMARQNEIMQGRSMYDTALSRQTQYEMGLQQMEADRWAADARRRQAYEDARALEEQANRDFDVNLTGAVLGGGGTWLSGASGQVGG